MKRLKGIYQDSDPIDQPEGTYRDALNMLINKRKGAISSEEGTADLPAGVIPEGYEILGDTLSYDGRHTIFLTDGNDSEIGVFNGQSYITVINNPELGFQSDSIVDAVSLINNKEELVVYWTDGINAPRFINIDDPLVNFESPDSLNIFPVIDKAPVIQLNEVNTTGGSLKTGAYHFGIVLIDDDDSRTNYTMFTPPIYVNDDGDVTNHDVYDGAPAGTDTSKSIRLRIENLDTNYANFQLVAIRKEGGTIAEVSLLPEQNISNSQDSYLYTGGENVIESSLEEVLIDTANYNTARSIVEIDNTLYLGNLTSKPDIGFQKYANSITVQSETQPINENVEAGSFFEDGHYGNPQISYYNKSFRRGEVYAFYVAFILKSGQESKAYHIPGRRPIGTETNEVSSDSDPNPEIIDEDAKNFHFYTDISNPSSNDMGYWENENENYPASGEDWQEWEVNEQGEPVNTGENLYNENVRHHHFPRSVDLNSNNDYWNNNVSSNRASTLGISLSNINIPNEMIEQIRGIKIYYAKRTDANKRIVDQALVQPLKAKEPVADVDDDIAIRYAQNYHQLVKYVSAKPFTLMRTQDSIGSLTHVEIVHKPTGDAEEHNDDRLFYDMTEDGNEEDASEYNGNRYRKLDGAAKAYIPANSFVELISKGFDYNFDNTRCEETICLQLDPRELLNFPEFDYSDNAQDTPLGLTMNLCSHKVDIFIPFDQQELVWTGFVDTDIEKYIATEAQSGNGNIGFSGSVGDFNEDTNGNPSEGNIQVDSVSGTEGEFKVEIDIDGDTAQTSALDYQSTPQQVAQAIAVAIDSDPIINQSWESKGASSGLTGFTNILSDKDPKNNTPFETSIISEDASVTLSFPDGQTLDDGVTPNGRIVIDNVSGTFGDFEVDITIGGNSVTTLSIPYNATVEDVANAIADAINNDGTLSTGYTASAVDNGSTWQTEISDDNVTGANYDAVVASESSDASASISYPDGQVTISGTPGTYEQTPNDQVEFDNYSSDDIANIYDARKISYLINDQSYKVKIYTEHLSEIPDVDITLFGRTSGGTYEPINNPNTSLNTVIEDQFLTSGGQSIGMSFINEDNYVSLKVELAFNNQDDFDEFESMTVILEEYDQIPSIKVAYPIRAIVNSGFFNSSYTIYQQQTETETDLRDRLYALMQADAQLNQYYTISTAVIEGRESILIVPNGSGSNYNASISIFQATVQPTDEQGNPVVTLSGIGTSTTNVSVTTSGGDVEIGPVFGGDTFISAYGFRNSGEADTSGTDEFTIQLIYFVCESNDNIKLRHQGEGPYDLYYPKSTFGDVLSLEDDDRDDEDDTEGFHGNVINYNRDYSAIAEIKTAIPKLVGEQDITSFPTRVIRSATGDNNLIRDEGLRTFLANDYIDLTRSRGELVKLSVLNNILIPHMERAMIRTKGREELTTGDFRAFLGAGDIFATRPDEIISTKEGFAGLQDFRSAIVTPFGYFFIDREAGRVYLVSNSPEVISENGLSNFFFDELIKSDPTDRFVSTFDPEHNRIILTKVGDWTLSYYPEQKMWGSFHTYKPLYYLYGVNTFYSLNNNEIFKHNEDNPGSFYGTVYPSYFDFVQNDRPGQSKQAVNIAFITEVEDQSGSKFYKETFDEYRVRNNYQDSGDQDLIYFTGIEGNARHVEGTWMINKFRDMLVDGIIDANKPWYNQTRLIGKFLQVKLTFNNLDNKSLYLYSAIANMKPSLR